MRTLRLFPNLIFLQLLLINSTFAQEFYVEFKTELNSAKLKYDWTSAIKNQSSQDELSYNFSIGLSGQLYKFLFLKTTVGTNDFENLINASWNSYDNGYQFVSWTTVRQNFLEILPEVRLFKNRWLYANAGIGFSRIRNTDYRGGLYQVNSDFIQDENFFPSFQGNYEYLAFNCGFTYQYKRIGVLGEFGLRSSSFTGKTSETPGLGINQKSLKLGVVYRLN